MKWQISLLFRRFFRFDTCSYKKILTSRLVGQGFRAPMSTKALVELPLVRRQKPNEVDSKAQVQEVSLDPGAGELEKSIEQEKELWQQACL